MSPNGHAAAASREPGAGRDLTRTHVVIDLSPVNPGGVRIERVTEGVEIPADARVVDAHLSNT